MTHVVEAENGISLGTHTPTIRGVAHRLGVKPLEARILVLAHEGNGLTAEALSLLAGYNGRYGIISRAVLSSLVKAKWLRIVKAPVAGASGRPPRLYYLHPSREEMLSALVRESYSEFLALATSMQDHLDILRGLATPQCSSGLEAIGRSLSVLGLTSSWSENDRLLMALRAVSGLSRSATVALATILEHPNTTLPIPDHAVRELKNRGFVTVHHPQGSSELSYCTIPTAAPELSQFLALAVERDREQLQRNNALPGPPDRRTLLPDSPFHNFSPYLREDLMASGHEQEAGIQYAVNRALARLVGHPLDLTEDQALVLMLIAELGALHTAQITTITGWANHRTLRVVRSLGQMPHQKGWLDKDLDSSVSSFTIIPERIYELSNALAHSLNGACEHASER